MNNVDDINYKLIGKLFVNVAPNVDQKFSDNYIKYFLRILNSQLNVTTNNEANIMNLIVDKAIKISPNTNQDKKYNTMERLQNLYSALVNKKVLKSRWGILYALLRLSQDKNDEFRESNKLLSRIFSLKNETNNYTINTSPYVEHHNKVEQSTLSNNKTFQSPLVVISSKTNKHITEKELINDLLFVLQGIDGHYINFDSLTNSFALNSLIPFQENIYDIVLILTELGWLYKKVANHLNFFNEAQIPSQFIQSFSSAIQSELNEYYKLISLFKKMNLKEEENNDIEELSLKKIFLWTLEPIERMKWLAIACEGIYSKINFFMISFKRNFHHVSDLQLCEILRG